MSGGIEDILGDVPGRPNVKEFWQLSEIILGHDALAREGDDDATIARVIGEFVPEDVASYVSYQRAALIIRLSEMAGLAFLPPVVVGSSLWVDGFATGTAYATKYPKVSPKDITKAVYEELYDSIDDEDQEAVGTFYEKVMAKLEEIYP